MGIIVNIALIGVVARIGNKVINDIDNSLITVRSVLNGVVGASVIIAVSYVLSSLIFLL